MDNIATSVSSAAIAILQMALFCSVGILFGRYPRPHGLLSPETLVDLAAQVYWLYTPALLLSVFGTKLSLEMLAQAATVIAWSVVHTAVCAIIAWVAVKIVRPERAFQASFAVRREPSCASRQDAVACAHLLRFSCTARPAPACSG